MDFDDLMDAFGADQKVEAYFERLERLLRVKKLAKELNEPEMNKLINKIIPKLGELISLELEKVLREIKTK